MIAKSRIVKSLFLELKEREQTEYLTIEVLTDIRREFGLDAEEVETQKDLIEETIDDEQFGEVIYEDLESLSVNEDAEVEPAEQIGFEEVEESTVYEPSEPDLSASSKLLADEKLFNFTCHICSEIFERMCFLSNHTRTVHQTMPKVACTCGRFLSTWDSLMVHKRKHSLIENSFSCDLCNSSFRTKTGLAIHFKFKHENPTKAFICAICDKIFKDGSVLKAHMRTHLPDEEKFAFECEFCGKKMVNKWSLKYHITTIHEGLKNHFCHLCGRGFGNKSNLRSNRTPINQKQDASSIE